MRDLPHIQAELFKALAHPARLQILSLLRSGERCVCEIYPALDMEQSNVSRHLSILKKEGLVSFRKEGLKVIYRVTDDRVFSLIDLNEDFLRYFLGEKSCLVLDRRRPRDIGSLRVDG